MGIFNERVKQLRDEQGIISKELASNLEITESKLSYYINGDREPSYELLIKIANYFNVSTDYLVGRTNFKNFSEEILAQDINNKSRFLDIEENKKQDIEKKVVDIHNLLINYATLEEAKSINIDEIWKMVDLWVIGIKAYFDFISESIIPENYPLDLAKKAMDTFVSLPKPAYKRVFSMLEDILTNENVDKKIKNRVAKKTIYDIKYEKKPKENENNDEKNLQSSSKEDF